MIQGNLERSEAMKPKFKIPIKASELKTLLLTAYTLSVKQTDRHVNQSDELEKLINNVSVWLSDEKTKHSLLLYGATDSGKTTMARAIASLTREIYKSNLASERKYFISNSAIELEKMAALKPEEFERHKRTELLMLDDLGCESLEVKNYGNTIFPMVELLYYRYDHQLTTIITSNLTDEDIRNRYGERVSGRIKETFSKIHCVQMNNRERRNYE